MTSDAEHDDVVRGEAGRAEHLVGGGGETFETLELGSASRGDHVGHPLGEQALGDEAAIRDHVDATFVPLGLVVADRVSMVALGPGVDLCPRLVSRTVSNDLSIAARTSSTCGARGAVRGSALSRATK
ncbi:hypothetical protein DB30_08143 [Enhygromyxa salina]|uniref:Uncharacterized protein n=1 Tax=Enhygromyxa salina TaxID=215803 RepID=A0A0C2CQB0_9BACT|nr:hypothetical protein DB30_08143 [Enhygromyxa salina]